MKNPLGKRGKLGKQRGWSEPRRVYGPGAPAKAPETALAAKAAQTLPAAAGGRQRPARGLPGHPGRPGGGSPSQTPASDPSATAKMAALALPGQKLVFG